MSAIKSYYENLADRITEAVYEECFDMQDYLDSTKPELLESTFDSIVNGDYIYILLFISDRYTGADNMPKTAKIIKELNEIINDIAELKTHSEEV